MRIARYLLWTSADGLKGRHGAQTGDMIVMIEAERAEDKRGKNESEGVEGNDVSCGTSPGVAEQPQLGPNAPGKHQEPTAPKRRAAHGARL